MMSKQLVLFRIRNKLKIDNFFQHCHKSSLFYNLLLTHCKWTFALLICLLHFLQSFVGYKFDRVLIQLLWISKKRDDVNFRSFQSYFIRKEGVRDNSLQDKRFLLQTNFTLSQIHLQITPENMNLHRQGRFFQFWGFTNLSILVNI